MSSTGCRGSHTGTRHQGAQRVTTHPALVGGEIAMRPAPQWDSAVAIAFGMPRVHAETENVRAGAGGGSARHTGPTGVIASTRCSLSYAALRSLHVR
jgi:hypothetical protein